MSLPPLDRVPADQLVGLTGLGSSGTPSFYVGADSNLNLLVKNFSTSTVGSAVPSNASFIAGKNPSGNLTGLSTDASANLLVNIPTVNGTGSLAAVNAAVTLTLTGQSNAAFQLAGTFVATITFEASNDNANWTTVFSYKAGDNTISTTATVPDVYRISTAGFGYVRARVSAYTSGTVVLTANATAFASGFTLNASLPPGANNIGSVNQGTSPWVSKDQADGPVAPGTAASFSILTGGIFNSTLPTLANGQQSAIQIDSNGRLLISSIANPLPAGTNNIGSITNVTGTVSLPTGAATSALQTTINTTIAAMSAKLPAVLGATNSANSLSVCLATDQSPYLATAALQNSEITLLNEIQTNTASAINDTVSSGTITALNGTVVVNSQGDYTVSASITGTFVGTLVCEGQLADNTWVQVPMYVVTTTLPYQAVFSLTAPATVLITGGGYLNNRIRASAYTSGTVAVAFDASLAQQTTFSAQLGIWTAIVNGGIPSNGVDSGDPVKVGSVYNASAPVNSSGDRVDLQSDTYGRIRTRDVIEVAAVSGTITVGTTAVVAKVGATALTNRKLLEIYCAGNIVYYGYSASVTTTTGFPITKASLKTFAISDTVPVYLVAATAGNTVIVGESS